VLKHCQQRFGVQPLLVKPDYEIGPPTGQLHIFDSRNRQQHPLKTTGQNPVPPQPRVPQPEHVRSIGTDPPGHQSAAQSLNCHACSVKAITGYRNRRSISLAADRSGQFSNCVCKRCCRRQQADLRRTGSCIHADLVNKRAGKRTSKKLQP